MSGSNATCRIKYLLQHGENVKHGWIFLLVVILGLSACGSTTPSTAPSGVPAVTTVTQPTAVPSASTPPTIIPTFKPETRALTVFAAASLTGAFTELGKNFDAAHPGVTSTFNFAGSQILRSQLEQGAVADVFASANTKEMNTLIITDSLILKDTDQIFATNQLLVILPANNPANIQTLQDLAQSGVKIVLADASVPAGNYARQILSKMGKNPIFGANFGTLVLANVVSKETDVKQVVAKVQLGEADAGIVYISDSVAAPELKTIDIPSNFNVIARYPIATLSIAPQAELASEFIDYVLSAEGQSILQKWGFTPVNP
jgi:molybdate transport system substrate-binding protein